MPGTEHEIDDTDRATLPSGGGDGSTPENTRARTGHVVVCGLDGLGVRVVEQLRDAGQDVVVVDEAAPEALRREVRRLGAGLLVADATEVEALDAAGLAGSSADPDGLEHPPRRDTRVAAGDEAYLVGPYSELLDVLRHHRSGAPAGGTPGPSPDTEHAPIA